MFLLSYKAKFLQVDPDSLNIPNAQGTPAAPPNPKLIARGASKPSTVGQRMQNHRGGPPAKAPAMAIAAAGASSVCKLFTCNRPWVLRACVAADHASKTRVLSKASLSPKLEENDLKE